MDNVSNTSNTAIKENNKKQKNTSIEPKKNGPLEDNTKSVPFVNTWKIENFRQRLDLAFKAPILSPTFTHKFGLQTLLCKGAITSTDSNNGMLAIDTHVVLQADDVKIVVQCFVRDVIGREIRMSRIAERDNSRFKHVIHRSIVLDPRNKLLANDVLTVAVKIEVNRVAVVNNSYVRVKDVRLADDFANLLQSGSFSDLKLIVEERTIQAHKGILSCRSSVFASMFLEERSDVVEIKNFSYDVINEVLRFCYTGMVGKVSQDLMRASDEFDIAGLKIICEDAYAKRMTVENVAAILVQADRFHAQNLRKRAVEFISEKLKEVVKMKDFKLLSKTTIIEILSLWSKD